MYESQLKETKMVCKAFLSFHLKIMHIYHFHYFFFVIHRKVPNAINKLVSVKRASLVEYLPQQVVVVTSLLLPVAEQAIYLLLLWILLHYSMEGRSCLATTLMLRVWKGHL